ncbi:MAG: aspartate kinase [Lutibacter sp.]|jgi:aspartate kinase|nr:aspartate kinase [Lutibacter sp.]
MRKVYKFGGASVKDAQALANLGAILRKEEELPALIVVSAMGKMTNAFEKIVTSYCTHSPDLSSQINDIRRFHLAIIAPLFKNSTPVKNNLEDLLDQLRHFLSTNTNTATDFIYDQVVGFGELIATNIVSSYLNETGIVNTWLDVRDYIKTDASYRDAQVDWAATSRQISTLDPNKCYLTQGFLGADPGEHTTTLGREGSDYSAAIFAHCMAAESVTIWKDVAGVLNADPRYFEDTHLLTQISYREAIEMAFYGASVIHPKTLKPLENKNIPLYVRSFADPTKTGTTVSKGKALVPEVPCFILKQSQILLSISALDFSFMTAHNLSGIFSLLYAHRFKVNLIQNSALSFSVCVEDTFDNFATFLEAIKPAYKIRYWEGVSLYTIRHASEAALETIAQKGSVLLRQRIEDTVQIVVEPI